MKKILYIALVAAMFVGCNKDNNEPQVDRIAVRFTDASITRATATEWDIDDEIGIYMVDSGATSLADVAIVDGAKNISYTVVKPGSTGMFNPTKPTERIYYPINGTDVDLYAYYPWSDATVDGIYKVNVSDQNNLAAIDLMTAKVVNKNKTAPDVAFQFAHKLSKLTLAIRAGGGLNASHLVGLNVKVTGLTPMAECNLIDGTILNHGTIEDIIAKTTMSGAKAEAILIPTTSTTGVNIIFTLSTGEVFEWAIDANSLANGTDYRYNITIDRNNVKLTSKNIVDWTIAAGDNGEATPGISSIGDFYYSDGTWSTVLNTHKTPIGIVFVANTESTKGKIVSLDQGENMTWSSLNVATNATNVVNGVENMHTISQLDNWKVDYPAFAWVNNKNAANTDYSTATTGVWYLPAKDELKEFYTVWSTNPTVFNELLLKAKGTAIVNRYHLSSTEDTYDYMWYENFNLGEEARGLKQAELFVRSIRMF